MRTGISEVELRIEGEVCGFLKLRFEEGEGDLKKIFELFDALADVSAFLHSRKEWVKG
ncbi:MAG: hypothetical protein QXR87_04150 [Candidatus Hadarchaeales archaeon]